eukprot:CAMPEP_0118924628 /NCGR_PEP_ID=MMETSP1169-20130426/2673_1 /TAXON_ID=36882 /ORGANISM="Pyramimonas obovata, Strain CCMP722" /LENGTH=136 /DNA_ID=CAMNT_0006865757 /DNA_START=175 /DNA_END=582 /DNA_ORIENTATION=-
MSNQFSATEFGKCMATMFGGAAATALVIGRTGQIASAAPNGMTLRTPFRPMASPVLVATCAAASLATAYATNHYVNEVYGPAHGFEVPRTLTKEWTEAEKVYRAENKIMGRYGSLVEHIPRERTKINANDLEPAIW